MRVAPQLIALLKETPSVTAIVGQAIYADNPPQDDDTPVVVLSILSGIAHGTINNCSVRAYTARLAVEVVTDSRAQSEQVIEHIEDTLDGFSNPADLTHPIEGVTLEGAIQWAILNPVDGSDQRGYLCAQDYYINYRRI
jgi:hypothetical protein